jgi:hypothetical protein
MKMGNKINNEFKGLVKKSHDEIEEGDSDGSRIFIMEDDSSQERCFELRSRLTTAHFWALSAGKNLWGEW